MKNYSILLSAALTIFALASCQKEQDYSRKDQTLIEDAIVSVPFQLRANVKQSAPATHTTLDTGTWAVDWEGSDVIYAVTTDEEWGVAYESDKDAATIAEFVYDSVNGTFSTDMAITDGSHTFNFLYTAGQQKSYHRGASTTFQLAGAQTFDASDPTASLKLYDALAAQVTATTPTTFADVDMAHLFSLMKVTLNNKTGASVTVTKFEVEIPGENLYGIFNVTFGATPSASYSRNGGDKITVNISNGTIANNGSLDVYFVMGPVSGYTGEVTFTVTDNVSNKYSKTNTISAPGVTFAAGTYNTASYTLKTADPIECVTLDWNYPGGTAAELNNVPGVTTYGLGSDYAASHAPCRVKFDNTGDYIQIRTDASISSVSVGYKMIGGATTSYLNIYESTNGTTWGDRIDRLTISGSQNSTGTLTTVAEFSNDARFVKIEFEKGANVGIGTLSITKKNTDPAIIASDIYNIPAIGCTDESTTYTVKNFVDDVEVGSVSGCVSAADAVTGDILYSVSPNYESTAATGTIVLQSAGNSTATKTINVHQLSSSLTVSATEVFIPNNDDEITFTITSPEFGWSISADDDSHILFDGSGVASSTETIVTVTSDVEATDVEQTIATLTIYRNSNTADPQAKQVVVKKAKSGSVSWTRVKDVATLLAGGTFIIGYEATANSGVIIPMANTGSATTSAAGFMYSGANASSGNTTTINMSSLASSTNFEVSIVASTTVSGAICIKIGENYLGNTNTKNNCKLFTEEAATTSFTPTVGSNDVFTLTITANETYYTLQYNSGSPRFAVYGGTQKNVVIYKKG